MDQQLLKGTLSTIILQLLEEHGQMYGYEITQKVREVTKGALTITEGALYPALHKLEAEGLLTTETARVANRLRKYYRLTPTGTEARQQKVSDLQEFLSLLHLLLPTKPTMP
jgi:DNA-binding PadR family transcriptional regulator